MNKLFQRLKSLLAYKWHILYGFICVALIATFAFMVVNKYVLHTQENIVKAVENKQRVMLDLKTGKLVDEFSHVEELRKAAIEKQRKLQEQQSKSNISIIVSELGVNEKNTARAFNLPKQVGFSFSPYAPKSLEYSQLAFNGDRQTFVELPMDPGISEKRPAARFELNEKNSEFENLQNIEVILTKTFSPLGVVMPRDEIFSYTDQMPFVVDEVAKRNLVVVYKGKNKDKMHILADNAGSRLIFPDVIIDDLISDVEIKAKLKDIENISRENGSALLMIKAYPITISLINEWLEVIPQKGFRLVTPIPETN